MDGAEWKARGGEYGRAAGIVGLIAAGCLAFRAQLAPIDVVMVLLVGVVAVAARYRRGPAVLASVLSIAAFNFFFVPPYYTFNVRDTSYFLTFGVMLAVALTMSRLTARIREQREEAAERERRTALRYLLERELAAAGDLDLLVATATRYLGREAGGEARLVLTHPPAADGAAPDWPAEAPFGSPEERIAATWALTHGEPAGRGTARCGGADALLVPLRGSKGALGVISVRPKDPPRDPDYLAEVLLDLADLVAGALERRRLAGDRERARAEVEAERLRTALLSSLSHDLRTPLAGIEGAASSLLEDPGSLDAAGRRELLESILEESRRMSRLITNLLNMIRVETETLAVQKSWQPLEEPLGVALLRMEERLRDHPVTTRIPDDLPLVPIDELLIEQVFLNLLENAVRHTGSGTPVEIRAWPQDGSVTVEVADRGPGVPPGEEEAVFGRFYRATGGTPAGAGGGAGLGLTICRGIVTAHGGRMWMERREGGGASVRFTVPLAGPPIEAVPVEPAAS